MLKGVVGVFRHADRTPKQKLKMVTTNRDLLSFFKDPRKEVKLKNDINQDQLGRILEIATDLLANMSLLEENGLSPEYLEKLSLLRRVLSKGYAGTKVQLKPLKWEDDGEGETVVQALFICKWVNRHPRGSLRFKGGFITHTGVHQANSLGKYLLKSVFRDNKSLLENLQVYSNNERRVKKTAKELAKSLLEKPKFPMSSIHDNKETGRLLGDSQQASSLAKKLMDDMKNRIFNIMHMESTEGVTNVPGLELVPKPLSFIRDAYKHICGLCDEMNRNAVSGELCRNENPMLMQVSPRAPLSPTPAKVVPTEELPVQREEGNIRHDQDPGHLRLHYLRHHPQPEGHQLRHAPPLLQGGDDG